MKVLSTHGGNISDIEISNISTHGIWLFVRGKELFISYRDFPWFRNQKESSILNVEEQSPNHFYWPELDIDLSKEIIEYPERFPVVAKTPRLSP